MLKTLLSLGSMPLCYWMAGDGWCGRGGLSIIQQP